MYKSECWQMVKESEVSLKVNENGSVGSVKTVSSNSSSAGLIQCQPSKKVGHMQRMQDERLPMEIIRIPTVNTNLHFLYCIASTKMKIMVVTRIHH